MIPYKLAKELKDAGFPQTGYSGRFPSNGPNPEDQVYGPDLEELIEACGDKFPKVIAELFHNTYEKFAPAFGYETREDTKKFDPENPNGKLMIKTVTEILGIVLDEQAVKNLWIKLNDKV